MGDWGRHRAWFGEENRSQMVEQRSCGLAEKLSIYLRMSMEMMERKLVTSQCDIVRSCHSFNPGFSLAQMGLIVTQEFSPPVIGWETERQPGGRGERMRLWQRVT